MSNNSDSGTKMAPVGTKKRFPAQRNLGDNLHVQRSSPVQEESGEEEAEFESVKDPVMLSEVDRARQRLADMEKRYNTITFKQKKQQKKKAMLEKYTSFNYNNTTMEWKKQV